MRKRGVKYQKQPTKYLINVKSNEGKLVTSYAIKKKCENNNSKDRKALF